MNTRILDLIKNPKLLQIEDLKLLELEIEKMPYIQSLRAIYLLGTHQFCSDNFQTELTKTAAYTTDKKILYNFINQNKTKPIDNEQVQTSVTKTILEETKTTEPLTSKTEISRQKEVITEDILSENTRTEEISTKEIFKLESTISDELRDEKFPSPTGIDFYARKINPNKPTTSNPPTDKTKIDIIDFYAQPRNQFQEKIVKSEPISPMSFYEKPITPVLRGEITPTLEEKEKLPTLAHEWKPMQLDTFSTPPKTIKIPKKEKYTAITEEKGESMEKEKVKEETIKTPISTSQNTNNSNISTFIDTWQNWLKIDRTPTFTTQEKKAIIIDKFIENNPKISPIKEDVEFIIKEKSDDISHLMTETLAQLYTEQKLYTKAIKAYQILQEKYPERTVDFEEKIEEIKKSRNGK